MVWLASKLSLDKGEMGLRLSCKETRDYKPKLALR
ncbi:hypothetical protein SLEP1_g19784 [Rubroshorea leprosula]|uniref:Uncharacterized protein n=1 Tax=Rubroshorea leprosula TaxID=152421 RepID=A0AAV5J9P5_9ROSI|nr:hypothetical protein SLEP1_g19784 [Rubroshorea leprosula]